MALFPWQLCPAGVLGPLIAAYMYIYNYMESSGYDTLDT